MNSKRHLLGAIALLPLLAIAGEPPLNSLVGMTISVVEPGISSKRQSAVVARGGQLRLGGTLVEFTREFTVDAQGRSVAVKDVIEEGLLVTVNPIAILDDRAVVRVDVQERRVIKVDQITIQGRTVDLPQTTLREVSLGNTTLTYGSALDVPIGEISTKYQLRLQADRP